MRFVLISVLLAMPLLQLGGEDKRSNRALMYTTQRNYSFAVSVSVSDAQTGAVGQVLVVPFAGGAQKSIPIRITRAQFESIWSRFLSSGINQYPIENVRHSIDLDYYYLFVSSGHKYAVPKSKASPGAASLARQMEAYANDKSVGLQNLPKRVPSTEPERVIVQ